MDYTEKLKTLLSSHNIEFKESPTHIKCRCIFHEEHTPSLSIRKTDGLFKCFGCGQVGGFNTLYYKLNNARCEDEEDFIASPKFTLKEKKIIDPQIEIIGTLYDPLKNSTIRDWLKEYGILDEAFIRDQKIMYSVYSEMIAQHLALSADYYTAMKYRVCSPIYKQEKMINVEGRTYIGGEPKVLYVQGGSTQWLYNFDAIDLKKDVVVVEGIKGLWRVWNVYHNVVAMFHALPSDFQIELLQKIEGRIIILGDNDHGFFGSWKEGKFIKGTAHTLEEKLGKEFYYSVPKKIGDDPNDCSLQEIGYMIKYAQKWGKEIKRIEKNRFSIK